MDTPFCAGRDFNGRDTVKSPPVVIINQAAMGRFFRGESPIGRTINLEVAPDVWHPLTVVGVVGDTAYQSLRETPPPLMSFPEPAGAPGNPSRSCCAPRARRRSPAR